MGETVIRGDFEWDADKAAANEVKHGVSFEEAATVFADRTVDLPDANDASRVLTIGFSSAARVLLVVTTEGSRDRVRIISARKATREERQRFTEDG